MNSSAQDSSLMELSRELTPRAVSQFLATHAWELESRQEQVREIWRLLSDSGSLEARIMLPLDSEFSDFRRRFYDALHAIRVVNDWDASSLLEHIQATHADLLYIRLDQSMMDGTIPFKQAEATINAVHKRAPHPSVSLEDSPAHSSSSSTCQHPSSAEPSCGCSGSSRSYSSGWTPSASRPSAGERRDGPQAPGQDEDEAGDRIMSRRINYKSLQKKIVSEDRRGIEHRWEYGRAILNDPHKMSVAGKILRRGAIEALIADAKSVGSKLSEREIQYRIQCARTYKTITQLRTAACGVESWTELREAGFPPAEADETPSPESLLDAIEKTDPQEFEQLGLFPEIVKDVPLQRATLRHLVAYAEEMRSMTESYARRDEARAEHLRVLTAAVHGDLDATYPDAVAALHATSTAGSGS